MGQLFFQISKAVIHLFRLIKEGEGNACIAGMILAVLFN
jgi:hypothetical protein